MQPRASTIHHPPPPPLSSYLLAAVGLRKAKGRPLVDRDLDEVRVNFPEVRDVPSLRDVLRRPPPLVPHLPLVLRDLRREGPLLHRRRVAAGRLTVEGVNLEQIFLQLREVALPVLLGARKLYLHLYRVVLPTFAEVSEIVEVAVVGGCRAFLGRDGRHLQTDRRVLLAERRAALARRGRTHCAEGLHGGLVGERAGGWVGRGGTNERR